GANTTGESEMSDLTRRDFVTTTAATAAAVACGCMLCDGASAADAPPARPATGPTTIDIGTKADYAKDGITDKWADKVNRVLVIRHDGKLYAPTATCTHKNCVVKLKSGEIVCPCHGSRYTVMGTPTKGPAKVSLYRYGVSVNDG